MARTWIDKLTSSGWLLTIILALAGQAGLSLIWQVKNNEQQQAKIEAVDLANKTLRSEIVNLQTPLSAMVLKMEGRVGALEMQVPHLEKMLTSQDDKMGARIDSLDRGGTRELAAVLSSITRITTQTDRNSDRLVALEKVMADLHNQVNIVNNNISRLDERQNRISQALDSTYEKLTEFIRSSSGSTPNPQGKK